MCGTWGSDCTPKRWYDFLGSASNGFAPYDVFYHFETELEVTVTDDDQKKTFKPLQLTATPCSQPYENDCRGANCTVSVSIQQNVLVLKEDRQPKSYARNKIFA